MAAALRAAMASPTWQTNLIGGEVSQLAQIRSRRSPPRGAMLAGPHSTIDRILVTLVKCQCRLETLAADLPDRLLVCVGIAMGDEEAIHEFEHVTGHPQRAEGVHQPAFIDCRLE